jgi:hypothetical protein
MVNLVGDSEVIEDMLEEFVCFFVFVAVVWTFAVVWTIAVV